MLLRGLGRTPQRRRAGTQGALLPDTRTLSLCRFPALYVARDRERGTVNQIISILIGIIVIIVLIYILTTLL